LFNIVGIFQSLIHQLQIKDLILHQIMNFEYLHQVVII
jgi:hypothetical protein